MDRRTPFARADAPGRSRTSGEAGQPGGRAADLNASGRIPTPELVVDDIFGPRTRSRVILFQLVGGLEPTGIVDTDTWTLLDDVLHS